MRMEREILPSATNWTPISLAAAIASEDNELPRMRYPDLVQQFYDAIDDQKTELEHMICKLLQIPTCRIIESKLWRSGSFNVAILVRLPHGKNVYLRLPFLHRIGEYTFPGNVDEKIRTEAATYLWLQKHCPDIPIPTLYAFGLPNGLTVCLTANITTIAASVLTATLVYATPKYCLVA